MKGVLVAFEGIDGAGKYTQLLKVMGWIESELGRIVSWSSEPNDQSSPIGKHIRAILRHEIRRPDDPVELQRRYVIDRAQDIFCFIAPVLKAGGIYLIERYALSTIAYGMLSGKPPEVFINLHREVVGPGMVWPDLTVLLDVSVETATKRRLQARSELELFEKRESLERVRQSYLRLVHHPFFTERVVVVDGEGSPEEVFERVKKTIELLLPSRG